MVIDHQHASCWCTSSWHAPPTRQLLARHLLAHPHQLARFWRNKSHIRHQHARCWCTSREDHLNHFHASKWRKPLVRSSMSRSCRCSLWIAGTWATFNSDCSAKLAATWSKLVLAKVACNWYHSLSWRPIISKAMTSDELAENLSPNFCITLDIVSKNPQKSLF